DEGLTDDYENADHDFRILDSERSELRRRMRCWMDVNSVSAWGEFRFSAPSERWKIDLHTLGSILVVDQEIQVGFPLRLWLAFEESELKKLIAEGRSRQIPVLRWLPRALSIGFDVQQSRDWEEAVHEEEANVI